MEHNKKINHWCALCGTGYHACDSCSKEKTITPWRSLTDTVGHYKVFMVLRDYKNKVISREKAQELLSGLDLSDKESYKDNAKSVLSDIYMVNTVDKPVKLTNKQRGRKPVQVETKMKNESLSEEIEKSEE
jgi:hypothetical protein